MNRFISAKQLTDSLPEIVRKVRQGAHFTVLYRNRPAFQVIPVDAPNNALQVLQYEPLYRAEPVGRSTHGLLVERHDAVLYGQ